MSLYDYQMSRNLLTYSFDSLLMALMAKADSDHALLLELSFPIEWEELKARYNAPGGFLENDITPNTDKNEYTN